VKEMAGVYPVRARLRQTAIRTISACPGKLGTGFQIRTLRKINESGPHPDST
jgi:hypothetical protein